MNWDKYTINLSKFPSENLGSLFVLDKSIIPFVPQRVFFVHNVPGNSQRGVHAHKSCKQLIIVTEGIIKILIDDGFSRDYLIVDNPSMAILIPEMTWSTQLTISESSTICVLASEAFDKEDYFYNYEDFKLALSQVTNVQEVT
jgi:UDP-2-acetamido-3-amino-2,3-dideoxy-glucuronate N-acetyltransferase